jgi:hypothetical protein
MGVTKPKLPYVRAPQTMLPGPLKIFSVLFGRKILLLEKKICPRKTWYFTNLCDTEIDPVDQYK